MDHIMLGDLQLHSNSTSFGDRSEVNDRFSTLATDIPIFDESSSNLMHNVGDDANDVSAPPSVASTSSATQESIQDNCESKFFSQEASSIYDKALEMHAAPSDEPPVWGEELEDLREAAEIMLEGMEGFSTEIEDLVAMGLSAPPNFCKTPSKQDSVELLIGDTSTNTSGSSLNETNSGSDIRGNVGGSNTAASSIDDANLSLHALKNNMDECIFEDSIFMDANLAEDEIYTNPNKDFNILGNKSDLHPFVPASMEHKSEIDTDVCDLKPPIKTTATVGFLPVSNHNMNVVSPAHTPSQQTNAAFQVVTPTDFSSRPINGLFAAMSKDLVWTKLTVPEQPKGSIPSIQLKMRFMNQRSNTALSTSKLSKKHQNYEPKGTNKSDAAWKRRYLELEEFKCQHGHCNVPQKYDKNPSLGAWVARQRIMMRQYDEDNGIKGPIDGKSLWTCNRVEKLKSLGLEPSLGKGAFGKVCTRNANEWEKKFADLIEYRDTHGTCNVPTKCTSLGRWVASQRKKYRQFVENEGTEQDLIGWSKELRQRFQRLKDAGFSFYVGKGNAQPKRRSN